MLYYNYCRRKAGSKGLAMKAIGFAAHDHGRCVTQALAVAEARCEANGARLTPTRRQVLEILLRQHRALGAYDILAELAAEGRRAQPPIAYRALDFLVGQGLAHKVERLSAYVACAFPGACGHSPAFLICRRCGKVAEALQAAQAVAEIAATLGFALERTAVEALGLCPACQDGGAAA